MLPPMITLDDVALTPMRFILMLYHTPRRHAAALMPPPLYHVTFRLMSFSLIFFALRFRVAA